MRKGERVVTLEDKWRILVGEEDRPTLNDTSEKEEVCGEIDWIQSRLIQLLNKETKKITICVLRGDRGAERLIPQRRVYHERKGICENNHVV